MNSTGLIALGACLAMFGAWGIQRKTRDAGIVDVLWAFGMAAAGGLYGYSGTGPGWIRLTLAVVTIGWFTRLGWHILARTRSDPGEDGRYRAMRARLGKCAGAGFFVFFQLQAGFVVLLSLPFGVVVNTPDPVPVMVAAGVTVALIAFWGEITADRQLREFRANPANRGRTCRRGWWRLSRHPNYFFEWLHWFAYPLMGFGGPYGHLLWFAPLVMLIFLVFLTGIPFTEQQAIRSRGEDYRAYQRQTSAFFPWPPSNRT